MASEAARQKYPDRVRGPLEPMASVANAQYVIEREREAYDAGLVDALREAADEAQREFIDQQAGIGFARVRTDWLRERADRIEKEARG